MDRAFTATKGGLWAAFFLSLAVTLQVGAALAHGDEKPKHGGIMGRGDDTVTVEFVYKEGVVTVYIEDHDSAAPLLAENFKGAWVNVFGPGRPAQRAELSPAGENRLTASGLSPRVGDRLSARLILPNGMETWSVVTFRETRR
ncbi:MAG TPA: hypothetical protein VNH16_03625 [Burkholderiales bacterium]|nr:hypothetical protein [Burkholderiales bacterium]